MNENPLVGTIRAIIADALDVPRFGPSDVDPDAVAERVAAHFQAIGFAWPNARGAPDWFLMWDDGYEPPPREGIRPVFVVGPTTGET
jgi:hypothetical protein